MLNGKIRGTTPMPRTEKKRSEKNVQLLTIGEQREGYLVAHLMQLGVLRTDEKPHIEIWRRHAISNLHIGAQFGEEQNVVINILVLKELHTRE